MMTFRSGSVAFAALLLVACASGPVTPSESPEGSATGEATTALGAATSEASSAPAEGPATSAAPIEKPAGSEGTKEANALVLEVVFIEKGGKKVEEATLAELMKSLDARIATSPKLATPASKGVTAPRRVTATFTVEAPITDAKGLTIKMGLNGVEPAGKCPLFDLDQKLTMSGGKNTPADVLELRKAAVVALLDKLEPTAPTLKPAANCTAFKK